MIPDAYDYEPFKYSPRIALYDLATDECLPPEVYPTVVYPYGYNGFTWAEGPPETGVVYGPADDLSERIPG